MIRRPPRSTLSSSSAASDVYKRQVSLSATTTNSTRNIRSFSKDRQQKVTNTEFVVYAVSYTHLRAHETPEHLVCRLLLEKKKKKTTTARRCLLYILTTYTLQQ
eukprot:TRINITY_DN29838_c0_g1_i2.p1 TRINITY_DN29838_c0_g1~~TRINITY_DN29838_c0_g1_i2.p1  ORF type:complete len:104 (-),score=30.44 TRINITY_DN29838_c0_g1_i2:9-320(-)